MPPLTNEPNPSKSFLSKLLLPGLILLTIAAIGATAFVLMKENGFFDKAPYQEEDFIPNLLNKVSEINSAEYTIGVDVYSTKREAGATPFDLELEGQGDSNYFKILAESFSRFSSDISAKSSITIAARKGQDKKPTDWKINFSGEGDSGDLSYKVNVDLIKLAKTYYFRINNMPELFVYFPKKQWISWEPKSGEANSFYDQMYGEMESNLTENKKEAIVFFKQVAEIANQEKIIIFKQAPKKEKINDKSLYRYELGFRRETMASFFEKVIDLAKTKEGIIKDQAFFDENFLPYLQGDKFTEAFDYYDKNTRLTVWFEENGLPIMVEYGIRIVPKTDNQDLSDKQFMMIFRLSLDNINGEIKIEEPTNTKTFEEVMEDFYPN